MNPNGFAIGSTEDILGLPAGDSLVVDQHLDGSLTLHLHTPTGIRSADISVVVLKSACAVAIAKVLLLLT